MYEKSRDMNMMHGRICTVSFKVKTETLKPDFLNCNVNNQFTFCLTPKSYLHPVEEQCVVLVGRVRRQLRLC